MLDQLTDPTPWDEAFRFAAERDALPTSLGHAELVALRRQLGERALVLARVSNARILSAVLDRVSALSRGVQTGPGEYMDPATFRVQMQEILRTVGYQPDPDREGTISDLRTKGRLDLIVQTEEELASGRAQQAADAAPEVLDAFPVWELIRVKTPEGNSRDWRERWSIAAQKSGDEAAAESLQRHGRMAARKDSTIWSELGNSDNFDDALDTDHPPFAFRSGMGVKNINRATAMQLGLIQRGDTVRAPRSGRSDPAPSTNGIDPSIRAALAAASRGGRS